MTVVPGSERNLSFSDPQAARAEFARRALDIGSMLPIPDSPPDDLSEDNGSDYVPLTRRSPGALAAFSLRNMGRIPVPLLRDGTPAIAGVPGWAATDEYFEAHLDAAAGSLTGPERDLLAVSFSPDAWSAFKAAATRKPQTRKNVSPIGSPSWVSLELPKIGTSTGRSKTSGTSPIRSVSRCR